MPKLTLSNLYSGKPYMVWLEPYAEDYWIPPEGELSIEFEDADFTKGVIRDGPFDVSWVDEGVVVWPAALSGVIVRDKSGAEVECGHERPTDIDRARQEKHDHGKHDSGK